MTLPYLFMRARTPRLGYLVDADYNGEEGCAVLRFLDPATQTIFEWFDNSGHTSYLLTDMEMDDVALALHKDSDYMFTEDVTKYDAILDKDITLRKVYATNPLAIGGDSVRRDSFRGVLQSLGHNVWEAWIRYYQRYCYDVGVEMGMPYMVTEQSVIPVLDEGANLRIENVLEELRSEYNIEYTDELHHWLRIFEHPLPPVKITSIDIEVLPTDPNRMPNAIMATEPVIAISFVTSTGKSIVLMLKRVQIEWTDEDEDGLIDVDVEFFEKERDLVLRAFEIINEYPFVATFNGDDFDLMYLYNRANKYLGISRDDNPIYVSRKQCKLKNGVHIDLYHFFKNRSIQNYAFKAKYKNYGLDDIAKALLGKGKLLSESEGGWLPIAQLTYVELGSYCLRDAELTYELLMFKNNVTINLILSLSKMANLPISEISRRAISDWVRSTLFYIHTKKNMLIPSQEQLKSKGEIQTEAKIKGKKYRGAIVKDPAPGVYFNVSVLDFQSLYPSEVKHRNIGYATINCSHPECKDNKVPYTDHWICIKNRAIEANVIGGLRDIRVFIYKPKAKDKSLTEEERAFYSCLEQAIKVYLNASYGVFGSESFALYCPPVAEGVTAYSRRDMTAVVDKSTEIGTPPIYGDTDSIFLYNPTPEQIETLEKWAMAELELDLGVDKEYRYVVFTHRKKNYLGVFKDGTADITGLTGKKSQIPDIIKKPFFEVTEVLEKVEAENDFEPAKKRIWELIRDVYHTIIKRNWDSMAELAFHMRLGRHPSSYTTNPQHVKAAKMLIEMGHNVGAGDTVHYIKSTNKEKVMPLIGADPTKVNIGAYVEQLQSVFDQVIEPLGINFKADIIGDLSLDNFPSTVGGPLAPSPLVDLTTFLPQSNTKKSKKKS